jgi:hypothetical protein
MDFALSMIKLHGFGGETEFWDHGLESFTLMAGLAAVTSRISNIRRWACGQATIISANGMITVRSMYEFCTTSGPWDSPT